MNIDFQEKRRRMVQTQISARNVKDIRVLNAMEKVPRHKFVSEGFIEQAYDDTPLPIGFKQTISQPYTVAVMTEALELKGDEKVLEIGTGSGYQCAILAELAKEVYSIERIPELAERARSILNELGYENIKIKVGDGTKGWKEYAPYQRIIITAGAPEIPEPLLEELDIGGIMVIPVGDRYGQDMLKVVKERDGFKKFSLGAFRFVELVGEYGYQD